MTSKIEYNCTSCGKSIYAEVGQTVISDHLKWYISYQCQDCGAVVEVDDVGLPPETIRALLIQNGGRWKLRLEDKNSNRVTTAKVLRKALGLSIADTASRMKQIPGTLYAGTQAEVEWLAQVLASEGVVDTRIEYIGKLNE
jgi:DNA-directed RNA polymerase subunit RPC12/RpoP